MEAAEKRQERAFPRAVRFHDRPDTLLRESARNATECMCALRAHFVGLRQMLGFDDGIHAAKSTTFLPFPVKSAKSGLDNPRFKVGDFVPRGSQRLGGPRRPRQANELARANASGGVCSGKAMSTLASDPNQKVLAPRFPPVTSFFAVSCFQILSGNLPNPSFHD